MIPIAVGEMIDTFIFWKKLFDAGIFTNPAVPPAVTPGNCLIRISYMASHTNAELNLVLDVFEKVECEFGLI